MTRPLSYVALLALLVLPGHAAIAAIDPEDQKLIDAASCEQIVREYRNYYAAEKEVESQIRQSNAGTAAAIAEGARKKGCRL